ncbi:MAG: hypothetical protein ACRYFW_08660 [Janthinobacterium lividum]
MHDDLHDGEKLGKVIDQISALIAFADADGDSLLGALLCDARDHVERRRGKSAAG